MGTPIKTVVFDIGGGSSELIWLDLRTLGKDWKQSVQNRAGVQDAIAAWTSLPLGVVNLAERHGGRNVTTESYEAMVETEPDTWIDVRVPWSAFTPAFRGRRVLDHPQLDPSQIKTFGFLIAQRQQGPFELRVERIEAYRH